MPTYQYRCTECGRDLEVVQKFSDASLTECPTCSGALRKVFNAVGVVFKGSGFYRNDSRAGNGNSDGSDSGGDKKPVEVAAKSDKTSESKANESKASESKANGSTSGDKPAKSTGSGSGGNGAASGSGSSTGAKATAG